MNFKTAVLKTIDKRSNYTGSQKKAVKRAREEKHPLLWRALQNKVAHMYEQDTGEKVGADWSAILDWLLTNLPKILALILSIFG